MLEDWGMSSGLRQVALFFYLLGTLSSSPVYADPQKEAFKKLNLVKLNEDAPNLLFYTNGKKKELKDYFGKPIILHLWATWCTSCQKEIPNLKQLEKAGEKRQIVFLPVSVDEEKNANQVKQFLDQMPIPKNSVESSIASPGDALKKYQTWGIPVTYFIDPSGKVIARALGMRDWSSVPNLQGTLDQIFPKTSK